MGERYTLSGGALLLPDGRHVCFVPRHAALLGALAKAREANPISAQTLARVWWGPADQWPETWHDDIKCYLSVLRHELKIGGSSTRIDVRYGYGYFLTPPPEVIA